MTNKEILDLVIGIAGFITGCYIGSWIANKYLK